MNRMATDFYSENTRYSTEDEVSPVFAFKGTATEETHQVQLFVPAIKTDTQISDCPWFTRVNGCFVCYDVTDKESFMDIETTYWYEELRRLPTMPVVVIGNHADETTERQTKVEDVKKWCRARYLPTFDVSAANGKNLPQALDAILVLFRRARDGFPLRTRLRSFSESESSSSNPKGAQKSSLPGPGGAPQPTRHKS